MLAAFKILAVLASASAVGTNFELDTVVADNVPAWVISLKRTPLRLALFKQMSSAEKVFPKLEVYDAVDGKQLNLIADPRVSAAGRVITKGSGANRRKHADVASAGMIGLYISHVEIWRAFLETDALVGVVFEDDARVPSDGAQHFNALLQSMPPADTWDVWFLGLLSMFESAPAPRSFGPGWVRPTSFFGTQAYLVTRRGAERLLAHAYPCTMQVDAFMATMSRLGQIVAVTRTDKTVQWSQFGLITGTTVQFVYCDMCDIPERWHRVAEERWWQALGLLIGLCFALIPASVRQTCLDCMRCACCRRCCSWWPMSYLATSLRRSVRGSPGKATSSAGRGVGGSSGGEQVVVSGYDGGLHTGLGGHRGGIMGKRQAGEDE